MRILIVVSLFLVIATNLLGQSSYSKKLSDFKTGTVKKIKSSVSKVSDKSVKPKTIYNTLPPLSYAKIKFMTGPIAPVKLSGNTGYPVSGMILDRFVAPIAKAIEVGRNCNFGGIARGNAALNRLFIDVHIISCTLEDGKIWMHPVNGVKSEIPFGYVVGDVNLDGEPDNYLGLEAEKVSNEGQFILLKTLNLLFGDYWNYLADAQLSSTQAQNASGSIISKSIDISGDKKTYALGKAIGSHISPDLNQFIIDSLKDSQPYLMVESTISAFITFDRGIDINGLVRNKMSISSKFESSRL